MIGRELFPHNLSKISMGPLIRWTEQKYMATVGENDPNDLAWVILPTCVGHDPSSWVNPAHMKKIIFFSFKRGRGTFLEANTFRERKPLF